MAETNNIAAAAMDEKVLQAKSIIESVIAAFDGNTADTISEPTYALGAARDLLEGALEDAEVAHG
ncbi:MAG TPA: hypothetical protein VK130_07650 [Steroidobacteraceae bacterium]|nr:hypothetical protein [Steroidobacteraceae bacterium]